MQSSQCYEASNIISKSFVYINFNYNYYEFECPILSIIHDNASKHLVGNGFNLGRYSNNLGKT